MQATALKNICKLMDRSFTTQVYVSIQRRFVPSANLNYGEIGKLVLEVYDNLRPISIITSLPLTSSGASVNRNVLLR
jgi:hypothetical protein